MRAAVRDRYGPPEVVRLEEIDTARPGRRPGTRPRCRGVRQPRRPRRLYPKPAFVRLFMGVRAPRQHRVGMDVAGVVEAVGPAVDEVQASAIRCSPTCTLFGTGSFAEYVCVPERALATIPDGMSLEEASTLPHAAILALQGLRLRNGRTPSPVRGADRRGVRQRRAVRGPDREALRRGGNRRSLGGDKLDFVRSLGADHVIDYTRVDYTKTGDRYDWIVDVDGHYSLLDVRRALKPRRHLRHAGRHGRADRPGARRRAGRVRGEQQAMGLMLWWKPFNARRGDAQGADRGRCGQAGDRPAYPLSEVVDALRYVDEGHARGKVVVLP